MHQFKKNKYTNIYFSIIDNARREPRSGYTENHHIVPRCLGGVDEPENLVRLSAREHFVAHLLLIKMVEPADVYRMVHAIVRFQNGQHLRSRDYEILRVFLSNYSKGELNASYGKVWCHDPVTKEVFYILKEELETRDDLVKGLPEQRGGFGKGRIWVKRGNENKMIEKHELSQYEGNGWSKGRHNSGNKEHMVRMAAKRHTKTKDQEHSGKMKKYHNENPWKWMNDGTNNKQVPVTQVDDHTINGWKFGLLITRPNPSSHS